MDVAAISVTNVLNKLRESFTVFNNLCCLLCGDIARFIYKAIFVKLYSTVYVLAIVSVSYGGHGFHVTGLRDEQLTQMYEGNNCTVSPTVYKETLTLVQHFNHKYLSEDDY